MWISAFFRIAFPIVVAALLVAVPASAEETVRILDESYPVLGVRISKSSSARLANIRDPDAKMMERSIYLLAGTRLLVAREFKTGEKKRQWALAITEDGLLVYVRTDGTHYFERDFVERIDAEYFAVAQTQFPVDSQIYGSVWITPSEVFEFLFGEGETIEIVIDKRKMGDAFIGADSVTVDIGHFSIIRRDDLIPDQLSEHFRIYDLQSELRDVLDGVSDLNLSDKDREAIGELVSRKFVTSKSCEETIDFRVGLSAEATLALGSLLSPLDAKLGLTGAYSSNTVFPAGVEFEIQRYQKGTNIVEIRHETIREKCTDLGVLQRVIAAELAGLRGEINTLSAEKRNFAVTESGYPIYTCRAQYLDLLAMLTKDDGELSREAATLMIAQFARYKGAGDASACEYGPGS